MNDDSEQPTIDWNSATTCVEKILAAKLGKPAVSRADGRNLARGYAELFEAVSLLIPGWQAQGLAQRVEGARQWIATLVSENPTATRATRFGDGTVLMVASSEPPDKRTQMPQRVAICRIFEDGQRLQSLYDWSNMNLGDGQVVDGGGDVKA